MPEGMYCIHRQHSKGPIDMLLSEVYNLKSKTGEATRTFKT